MPRTDIETRLRRALTLPGNDSSDFDLNPGVPLPEAELKELASALKKRCGCGGGLKDGVIEIQGDMVDLLLEELAKRGFKAKKSGG